MANELEDSVLEMITGHGALTLGDRSMDIIRLFPTHKPPFFDVGAVGIQSADREHGRTEYAFYVASGVGAIEIETFHSTLGDALRQLASFADCNPRVTFTPE